MKIKPLLLHAEQRQLLYPESHSRRRLPLNFEASDLGLFEHELEKSIPATALLQFDHCRVAASGMLFRGVRVFEESFGYRCMLDEWASLKNMSRFFVVNYAFKKLQTCPEDAVLFIDNWSGAYFHWITDALPRLYALRDRVKGTTILLPMQYKQFEYTLPTLAPFRIGAIKYLDEDHVLLCTRLIVPTHTAPSGNYNATAIGGLRDLFINHFGGRDPIPGTERVYISRRKAKVRRIVNEGEVEVVLKQYGFRTVCFEDFTFAEQVAIASNARHIVSNHGAGLTNMLFMPVGGSVLELRKAGDSQNNCYFALASCLDLRYFYQLCETPNPNEDAHSAHLYVDPGRLRRNIDRMLAE
jgi:capsular polysaccharide biosynthesis protein